MIKSTLQIFYLQSFSKFSFVLHVNLFNSIYFVTIRYGDNEPFHRCMTLINFDPTHTLTSINYNLLHKIRIINFYILLLT